MKKLLITLIVIALIVGGVSVFKDLIIKVSVEKGVEVITGLKIKMQSLRVGIINTNLDISGLRIFNPQGYADRMMLNMPFIYVDYDLPPIIKGKIHLEDMSIHLEEFMVVKNEKGELNLNSLKTVKVQKEGKKAEAQAKEKLPETQIDSLKLKIDRVVYKDYSRGGKPYVKEYYININEKYENINDPYSLVSLIVVKALIKTNIANLTDFDLQMLQRSVDDVLNTAQQVVGMAAEKTGEAIKATTQKTEEAVKGTTETIKKTTEGITGILKTPFGEKEKE